MESTSNSPISNNTQTSDIVQQEKRAEEIINLPGKDQEINQLNNNELNVFPSNNLPTSESLVQVSQGGAWADDVDEIVAEAMARREDRNTLDEEIERVRSAKSSSSMKGKNKQETSISSSYDTPIDRRVQEILSTESHVLETLSKQIDEANHITRINQELIKSHEKLIISLQSTEKSLIEMNNQSNRQINSLMQRQDLMARQLERVKDEYLVFMQSAPQALNQAEKALVAMVKLVEDAGFVPPTEVSNLQTKLVEQTKAVNDSLLQAKTTKETFAKSKKLPHHLQKYVKK